MVKGGKRGSTAPSKSGQLAPVTRDYTIHVRKFVTNVQFKRRAPRAIREIRKFAEKAMGTSDVRIDTKLNKFLWNQGIRHIPNRVRVRIARKVTEDKDTFEKTSYSVVYHIPVASYKGLLTELVES